MTRQYLRAISLKVGDASGQGLDLSALRIVFSVFQGDRETPNRCAARVYNVADTTANQVQKEFTRIVLQAGYEGNIGTIFDGSIVQTRSGRENPTDTFLDIFGGEGDVAYNWAVLNRSLSAGWTPQTVHTEVAQSFAPYGISQGYVPEMQGNAAPRGRVLYGNSRAYARILANDVGTCWSIQGTQYQHVPETGYIPGDMLEVNVNTGMIGLPEQTQEGIRVRILLNPTIRPGKRILLNNKSIQQAQQNISLSGFTSNQFLPKLNTDGIYRALVVNHEGDTRGNPWYTDLVCIGVGEAATPALVSRGIADPG